MITEDYVSFEVAKLLKEKGFDEECRAYYVKSKECGIELFPSDRSHNYNDDVYPHTSAPTLQMAMKWLREKHNLSITVFLLNVVDGEYIGYHADIELMAEWVESLNKFKKVGLGEAFHTYEEAVEAAIKYCLKNLI